MIDYGKVRKKHLQLSEIKKLNAAMISTLPDIESVYDAREAHKKAVDEL